MRIAAATIDAGPPEYVVSTQIDGPWRKLTGPAGRALSLPELITALPTTDVEGGETLDPARVKLLNPAHGAGKIMGIGLNYHDHIRETGSTPPKAPVVFAKFASSLSGPFDTILADPDVTAQVDYEAELAVVIGRSCRAVPAADAAEVVFGYLVANDVSARDVQRAEPQFSRSKSFDTFCPLGPWITTADTVPDPQNLRVRSWVNDDVRQDGSTREMIFGIADLIAFLSSGMTLEPGDVILTGTPHGVGFARTPPVFLGPGDRVRCEIEGLGAIENLVVGPRRLAHV